MEMDEETIRERTRDLLEFETQIFLDVLHKDGLVVAAKGLSMDNVLISLFRAYSDPGNLVLVVNCPDHDEKRYCALLSNDDDNVHSTTYTTNVTEREDKYRSGGVHFVTTRILVVDMLKSRIPVDRITGIVVLRAHAVLESCQEAFVLRLYRQRNKTGFVKAFTNCAQSFTVGYGHVERTMRTLFVRELYIWPRFHGTVIHSLRRNEPLVVELHVPITETMVKVQTCLLDLMNLTVKEMKRLNASLELNEITVENALTKKFHKILQAQLDCVWNRLSDKTRQLIADLKTLRHLITTLLYTDAVTFYATLLSYRTTDYAHTATWVLLEPAERLFTFGRSLVFNVNKELSPEPCPKWKALFEVLRVEIPNEMKKLSRDDAQTVVVVVVVLCQDSKTCVQLKQLLTNGAKHYSFLMSLKHNVKFDTIGKEFSHGPSDDTTKKKIKLSDDDDRYKDDVGYVEFDTDLESGASSFLLSMSDGVDDPNYTFTDVIDDDRSTPTILIRTFKTTVGVQSLTETLHEHRPRYVVMYHSDMTAVRQIEVYAAKCGHERPVAVYFLVHAGTVEEQSYLTTLRREKEAFEHLVESKSKMVIPDYQDGKTDDCLALQRDNRTETTSTRQGGQSSSSQTQQHRTVIVDMREFRSELPALIHRRGIDIEPVTITIGDYILTPDVCVERKSISDLIGSLGSGRLYQQCTQMSRHYARPMLLIEFDQNHPFVFRGGNCFMLSKDDTDRFDVQQKLLLLTLHFPKLRIIWSPSPYASAQLFEELKDGKEQPSVEYATRVGADTDPDLIEQRYNSIVYDFVQKLPGVTSKNIDAVMRRCSNLERLVAMSEDELSALLGHGVDGKALHSALNDKHTGKDADGGTKGKESGSRPRNKFKFVRGHK